MEQGGAVVICVVERDAVREQQLERLAVVAIRRRERRVRAGPPELCLQFAPAFNAASIRGRFLVASAAFQNTNG